MRRFLQLRKAAQAQPVLGELPLLLLVAVIAVVVVLQRWE